MTEVNFDSRTARHGLPLLFAGQSQKETYVNEALARIDALIDLAIEGDLAAPPTSPADGQAWRIAEGATGEWVDRSGQIAARQAGNWLYLLPRDGLNVFNRATGQTALYNGGWQVPSRPAAPSGGTTADNEARIAIAAILAALTTAGVFAA